MSIRRSLTAGLVLIGAVFVVACSQTASPTAPSPYTGTLASPASSAPLSATSVDFVTDADGNGTAFRLTGFDGVELQGTNSQGSFTAVSTRARCFGMQT